MIENHYIQKLRDLDILRVADMLGMGIRQRRALCPHHDDHHPSLALNVRRQTCHCYSCGFSADNIGLVRERLNLGFAEACHWLADRFDVYIGDDGAGRAGGRASSRASDRASSQSVGGKRAVSSSGRRLTALREMFVQDHRVASADAGAKTAVGEEHSAGVAKPCQGVDVEYYSQLFRQLRLSESGRRFLLDERMISPEVVASCHIVSTEQNRCMARVGRGVFDGPSLLFPYFGQDGKLLSVQSRYLGDGKAQGAMQPLDDCKSMSDGMPLSDGKSMSGGKSMSDGKSIPRFKFAPGSHRMIYGLERLKDYPPGEPLLITEGPSDCWTALTLGLHAIAIPSATLFDRGSKELLVGRNLHVFPDQDEAGLSLYFELKEMFPGLVYHQLPEGCKDLSEYYLRLRRGEGMELAEIRKVLGIQ